MDTYFDRRSNSLATALHPEIASEGKFAHSTLNELQAPQGHSKEAVRAWLNNVIEAYHMKPTSWAKSAGLAPSTINRFLTSRDDMGNLSASTIDKLSSALIGSVMHSAHSHWTSNNERSEGFFSIPSVLVDVPMIGFVSENNILKAGSTDIDLRKASWNDRFEKTLTVPVPTPWIATKMVGFDVDGICYDPIYPNGSILICVPIFSMDGPPSPGKRLIVYEKQENEKYKTYLRELSLDPNGRAWFMPLPGTQSDSAPGRFLHPPQLEIIVKATFWVIASFRLEPETFGAQKSA